MRIHAQKGHKKSSKETFLALGGVPKLCECGCGEEIKFCGITKGYIGRYIWGHAARVKNNWGHNPIVIAKSHTKEALAGRRIWNKGLSVDTDERIAQYGKTISAVITDEEKEIRSKRMKENRANGTIKTLSGEESANWKGGVSAVSSLARAGLVGKWARKILIRDEFKCKICGTGKRIVAHHCQERFADIAKKMVDQYGPHNDDFEKKKFIAEKIIEYHLSNDVPGFTVCEDCHADIHEGEKGCHMRRPRLRISEVAYHITRMTQRNPMFGEGSDVSLPPPNQSPVAESTSGEIPGMLVPLPSRGLLYPSSHPLHRKDDIAIRPMSTRQEDILSSRALIKKGTVMNELIKSCLLDPRIEVPKLISGDKMALMVGIRVSGYGVEYNPIVKCGDPDCGQSKERQMDLSKLVCKYLDIDPVSPGVNAFTYKLPVSKRTVTFKFATGVEEDEMVATAEKKKALGLGEDNLVTMKLLQSIIALDGVTDRSEISRFVSSMPALDSLRLRQYIEDNEPGIDMIQETECPACGNVEEVSMPIDVTFFWPSARRQSRRRS